MMSMMKMKAMADILQAPLLQVRFTALYRSMAIPSKLRLEMQILAPYNTYLVRSQDGTIFQGALNLYGQTILPPQPPLPLPLTVWYDLLIQLFQKLIVTINPKMDRGSTGSRLTTAKRGKNQQAGNFRRLEPSTLVMGTCNSKPDLSCRV